MNVDTQRRWDRLAGTPLCLLGTIVKRILAPFGGQRRPQRPRNVLFIGLAEMGSTILAEPAMRKLRRALDVQVYYAIFERNRASLDLLGTVPPERTFTLRDTGLASLASDTLRFWSWTRRNRIDTVVDLELFSRFTALLTGFSGAARTAGFHGFTSEGLYRGDFLTHRVAYNPHHHIAKNFIALVNALLAERPERPYSKTAISDAELALPHVTVTAEARALMQGRIREAWPAYDEKRHTIVLLNTDASALVPLRRWPREHFVRLARALLERHPRAVLLLIGSAAERASKDALVRDVGGDRCVNFAGKTSVPELPALFALSACLVSNDSGPAHFAAVTSLPTFVIFGPESPRLYAPLGATTALYAGLACSPCVSAFNHRRSPCDDNVCVQVITPERVLEAMTPVLSALADAAGA